MSAMAIAIATCEAKAERSKVLRHYRKQIKQIVTDPMPKGLERELYAMGWLPPVFPLPVATNDWLQMNTLRWYGNEDGFWNSED